MDDWGYPHDLRKLSEIALLILICGRDPNAADVFLTWRTASKKSVGMPGDARCYCKMASLNKMYRSHSWWCECIAISCSFPCTLHKSSFQASDVSNAWLLHKAPCLQFRSWWPREWHRSHQSQWRYPWQRWTKVAGFIQSKGNQRYQSTTCHFVAPSLSIAFMKVWS